MITSSNGASILEMDLDSMSKALWHRLNRSGWPLSLKLLPKGSALVGGAVRDGLLNRLLRKSDLDFVVPNSAIRLAKALANLKGGKCVILDQARDMARWIFEDWTIDFSSQCGESLEDDLKRRDYTINSIALLCSRQPQIFDPIRGISDLLESRLVAISEQNLKDDPLRILRGLRFIAKFDLTIDSATKYFIERNACLLPNVSPERIQYELKQLASLKNANKSIDLLKKFNLLAAWENQNGTPMPKAPDLSKCSYLSSEEIDCALPLAWLTHLLDDKALLELRFSKKERSRLEKLRYWQIRDDGSAFKTLEEQDRLKLHQDLETDLPALLIHFDQRDQKKWIERWRDSKDPLFHPYTPLDGSALKDSLNLKEGSQLGELIRYLCQEQAFGRVKSRQEALNAARKWFTHNEPIM